MVGDVHLSDRPPATRTANYSAEILAKLGDLGPIARERECSAVVFVGDIFHSKVPRNTSHDLVAGFLGICEEISPIPIYIVPGNHDYRNRDIYSLGTHPLGVVGQYPGVTLFGLPGSRTVRAPGGTLLWGVREEEPIEAFEVRPPERDNSPVVVVAHSAIFPPNRGPHWPHFDAQEVDAALKRASSPVSTVYYGHIHEPHGAYVAGDISPRRNALFVNYGAVSRGSLHEEGAMERTPAVGLLEVYPRGYADRCWEIPLPSAQPASRVFRVERERRRKARAQISSQFFDDLGQVTVGRFSVEGLVASLRGGEAGADVPPAVVDAAIELLEAQV